MPREPFKRDTTPRHCHGPTDGTGGDFSQEKSNDPVRGYLKISQPPRQKKSTELQRS